MGRDHFDDDFDVADLTEDGIVWFLVCLFFSVKIGTEV